MYSRKGMAIPVVLMVLGLASVAWGGVPNLDNSSAVTAATSPVSIVVCPAGDGDAFTAARLYGGGTMDATITVTLLDANFVPVVGYAKEDVWAVANGLVYCPLGNIADYDTDVNGQTVFALPMKAGGCSDDNSLNVWVGGEELHQLDIPDVWFNSPDMDGAGGVPDLVVNLTDVVAFSGAYSGSYNYCADFYWDGNINLSDVVVLSQHFGHSCP